MRMGSRYGAQGLVLALAALSTLAACGARRPALPAGPGSPFPGFEAAYDQATTECRGVQSLTVSMGLSGRTGATRLRGRIDAGLQAPSSIRLEGFPPVLYGSRPFFVLVATGPEATLVLPRDNRVLRGERPDDIVEVLAGVPLGPEDLRSLIAGCGLAPRPAGEARLYDRGWASIDQGDATTFLRQLDGRWRVAAVTRGTMTVQYDNFIAGRPQAVRIVTAPASRDAATDLTLRLSDVEWNVAIDERAFRVAVPPAAVPLTLEELRAAGPLRSDGA